MAKLTWLGPDDYEAGETPPHTCTWNGVAFPRGKAVEVDDPDMIRKARGNRMFKVDDGGRNLPVIEPSGAKSAAPTQWREPATEADPADVSFFDDPPSTDELASWQLNPRGEAVAPPPLDFPPDYPPDDEPKRKPGRPRKVKDNGV